MQQFVQDFKTSSLCLSFFLSRDALHISAVSATAVLSVRLSVCLSHWKLSDNPGNYLQPFVHKAAVSK